MIHTFTAITLFTIPLSFKKLPLTDRPADLCTGSFPDKGMNPTPFRQQRITFPLQSLLTLN